MDTYAFADGRLEVRWNGMSLPYQVFDKDQRVNHAAIVENKRLGEVLAFIKSQQDFAATPAEDQQRRIGYQKTGRKPPGRKSFVDKMIETTSGGGWSRTKIASDDNSTLRHRGHFNLVATPSTGEFAAMRLKRRGADDARSAICRAFKASKPADVHRYKRVKSTEHL